MQQPVDRTQERLYHALGLPQETVEVRDRVRRFAENEIAPRVAAIEEGPEQVADFPQDLFRRMAELGLYRPCCVNRNGYRRASCCVRIGVTERLRPCR